MKYIKFSFFILLLSFQSCLWQEDDSKHYSCSFTVDVIDWNKTLNNCKYTVTINNRGMMNEKGIFQFKFKNASKIYSKHSAIYTIQEGINTIPIEISNCNFADEIIDVCFMQYK
ncbi:hypothetical protein OBK16_01040 [Empedobacter falsenii]